jgi:hypothetical protein
VYWDDDNRIKKGSIDKPTLRFEIDFREDKRGQEIVSKLPVIWHLGYVSYDLECGMRRPPSAERILSTMTDLSEILQQNHLSPIRRDEWEKLWIPEYERLHKETNHKSIKKSYRILGMKIDVLDRPDSGAA